jgi:hypothetical protein
MSSRWTYPEHATAADRDRIDQAAAEHGMDERDGANEVDG